MGPVIKTNLHMREAKTKPTSPERSFVLVQNNYNGAMGQQ